MGEAKRTGPHGGAYGPSAHLAFVRAWFAADDRAAIEFTDRQFGDGTWIIMATIGSGARRFTALLTPGRCRGIATAFEAQLAEPAVEPIAGAVSDLVLALRAAADEFERLHNGDVYAG